MRNRDASINPLITKTHPLHDELKKILVTYIMSLLEVIFQDKAMFILFHGIENLRTNNRAIIYVSFSNECYLSITGQSMND